MKFSKLVYTETCPADGIGRSMTVDFELEEITVDSAGGGVRWCRLGTHERSAVDAKLSSSRPEEWAERYAAPLGNGLDWTLRLFDGAALVKTSHGTNGFPPADRWDAFRLLADFCFTVTRRYGAPPEAR
jgi:hypothetical protein